jgi:hypothetical protein
MESSSAECALKEEEEGAIAECSLKECSLKEGSSKVGSSEGSFKEDEDEETAVDPECPPKLLITVST